VPCPKSTVTETAVQISRLWGKARSPSGEDSVNLIFVKRNLFHTYGCLLQCSSRFDRPRSNMERTVIYAMTKAILVDLMDRLLSGEKKQTFNAGASDELFKCWQMPIKCIAASTKSCFDSDFQNFNSPSDFSQMPVEKIEKTEIPIKGIVFQNESTLNCVFSETNAQSPFFHCRQCKDEHSFKVCGKMREHRRIGSGAQLASMREKNWGSC